ncbi:glycosyltransferase [Deferribacter abyssi]
MDLEVFKPRKSDFRKKFNIENKFIILGVANVWVQRKGFDYFIKLSQRLSDDEVIVLVGLNDKQLKLLPKNVIGIKRTSKFEELVEIYSSADVFVNPTLEDNFPTTNIESLACGTPVITFDSGGSPECLDEKCGYVIKKGDFKELYKKILEVKKQGKNYFSEFCIKQSKKFDKNKRFEEYINLYREIYESFNNNSSL